MASLLLRSARRSVPHAFPRNPPHSFLSNGFLEPKKRYSSKTNVGQSQSIGDGRTCRYTDSQEMRSLEDNVRRLGLTIEETEKWMKKRDKIIKCLTVPLAASLIWLMVPDQKDHGDQAEVKTSA